MAPGLNLKMRYSNEKTVSELVRALVRSGWQYVNGKTHGKLVAPNGRMAEGLLCRVLQVTGGPAGISEGTFAASLRSNEHDKTTPPVPQIRRMHLGLGRSN